jgi:hypothetical protein
MADIPVARGGFGTLVHNGMIYAFGGEWAWTCHDGIERYDPSKNLWEACGSMPEARHGIVAGVLEGRFHLVSGGRHPRLSASGIHRVLEIP